MDHAFSQAERRFISSIRGIGGFEFATIRLTQTMLDKSIIDANDAVRLVLLQRGIVNYAEIDPGEKVLRDASLILRDGEREVQASLYRPKTKNGDPRLWLAGLTKFALPSDMLLVGVVGQKLVATLVREGDSHLRGTLERFLEAHGDPGSALEADVRDLTEMLKGVVGAGWIRASGHGPRAVGETLERELGISANSFRSPDFRGSIEIKSARRGGAGLQTLFSQVPLWRLPTTGTAALVSEHGRWCEERKRREIYCTVTTKRNTLGWDLRSCIEDGEIVAARDAQPVLHFPIKSLTSAFEAKHKATVFVEATTRRVDGYEELQYHSAVLMTGARFPRLLQEIDRGVAGLDIVAHLTNGRARDHGYLWRIKKDRVPFLYSLERKLI